jgi:hypothetical protein
VFIARYALSPYTKEIMFRLKGVNVAQCLKQLVTNQRILTTLEEQETQLSKSVTK